jgi:hypothetical protein
MVTEEKEEGGADPEEKGAPSSPSSSKGGRTAGERRRLLLVVAVGVVIIVAAVVAAFVKLPFGSSPSSNGPPPPVDCSLGSLPPTESSPQLSLAAERTTYPAPENGTSTPEGILLWINTTGEALPGTKATFAVRPLVGVPGGPSCVLPIPSTAWTSSPANSTLEPDTSSSVAFTGTPATPYGRAGVFAVQLWVNTTGSSGPTVLGSLHTEIEVD